MTFASLVARAKTRNNVTLLYIREAVLVGLISLVLVASGAQEVYGLSAIRVEMYPAGQRTNPAILILSGDRYPKSLLIPLFSENGSRDEEVQFLSRLFAVSANGTLDDLLKFWAKGDRENIKKLASDPKLFEGNRNYYKSITQSHLLARVDYGSYEILYVSHSTGSGKPRIKDYPITRENGSIVLTNALQNDPFFSYLSTKYLQVLRDDLAGDKGGGTTPGQ